MQQQVLLLLVATIGFGVTASLDNAVIPGTGSTSGTFTGFLKGIIVGMLQLIQPLVTSSTIDIKVVSRVETVGGGSTETKNYLRKKVLTQEHSELEASSITSQLITLVSTAQELQQLVQLILLTLAVDWYEQQTLGLTNATTFWKAIAPRPVSNVYVTDRNGKNDGTSRCRC